MKSFAIIALASVAAALPQGVTEKIAPDASAPESCQTTYLDPFSISIMNVTSTETKRSLEKRQDDKVLTVTLDNGVLTDDLGRTGYIAANRQFQFDKPAQTGAIYTSGWSVCQNGTLALGASTIFYQCLSGDFYNLYDESRGEQCSEIYINILNAGGDPASVGGASQIGDGQLQAPTSTAGAVSQISDGQIQATTNTAAPVTQIGDGQIQAATSTAGAVSQIGDGQIQAPTATAGAVSQIGDGQIQAPTSTAGAITQIGDGQIQAPTSTAAPVTQIGDGQIQAPVGTLTPVVAQNGTGVNAANPSISVYTGAAALPTFAAQAMLAAGAFAVAML